MSNYNPDDHTSTVATQYSQRPPQGVPASTSSLLGIDDPRYWQNPRLPRPPQHSTDPQWDVTGRPLDRPRSRQQSNYGAPLPTPSTNWERANEMEQQVSQPAASTSSHRQGHAETQQPQPLPQVNHQQRLSPANMRAAVSRIAGQSRDYYAPPPPASHIAVAAAGAAAQLPVPEGAVAVAREITLEQSMPTRRWVPFTTNTRPPVTTIVATASAVTDQPPTVTIDQLRAIKGKRKAEGRQPEQDRAACQNGTIPELSSSTRRKPSFKRSLSRAGRKMSQAVLEALRSDTVSQAALEKLRSDTISPVVFRADKILDYWHTILDQFNTTYTEMEEAFDPFQDQIEEAFDAKYAELLGEGKFLVDGEKAVVPIEPPAQEVQVVPTEDADTWIAYVRAREATMGVCDPYTGSARGLIQGSRMADYQPKPRVYPAGPSTTAPQDLLRPEEHDFEEEQGYSTPDPLESSQLTGPEARQPRTPARERQSRLPQPSSSRGATSDSRQKSIGRGPSAALPVDEVESQIPTKDRKDSAQTGPSATPPVQRRAQSREQEVYPKVRNMKN